MFWPKEVIILRIGIKQRKVKKSHTSQSHSATVQWKRNASHIMTYIFKIYKHYSFCFLWTDYTTRTLHLEMRSVLFNFIQIYSVWKCNLDFHIAKPQFKCKVFFCHFQWKYPPAFWEMYLTSLTLNILCKIQTIHISSSPLYCMIANLLQWQCSYLYKIRRTSSGNNSRPLWWRESYALKCCTIDENGIMRTIFIKMKSILIIKKVQEIEAMTSNGKLICFK